MSGRHGATQLYGMARALRSNSEYARRMKFLSNSIFGEVNRQSDVLHSITCSFICKSIYLGTTSNFCQLYESSPDDGQKALREEKGDCGGRFTLAQHFAQVRKYIGILFFLQYYPAHNEISELFIKLRAYGLYRNEHEDFKEEMARIREIKGKVRVHKYASKKPRPKDEFDDDDEEE